MPEIASATPQALTDRRSRRPGDRRRVLVTGASGNWGRYVVRELLRRDDRMDILALVRPRGEEVEVLREFEDADALHLLFGDLTDADAVDRGVSKADVVLHLGAVVSPFADDRPDLAHRVNVGSIENIIRVVRALPNPAAVSIVGIGTVAEMGDRNPPHHWGRVGDPLQVARYDEYGQSKIIAEKLLLESGLPRWTWLRQTGIFHPGVLEIRDPIMTHSPFEGVMEWVSVEDAARLVANLCEEDVPEAVWGEVFNIGGGEEWRLTNWELQTRMTGALGVPDVRRWYERHWFATQNFHGLWYTDSDRLHDLVPFREDTFDGALERAVAQGPSSLRLARRIPPALVKNLVMKPIALKARGTMSFVRDGDTERLEAYYGSLDAYHAIGDWDTFWPPRPERAPQFLDHGYDEQKLPEEWTTLDLTEAADFRGGTVSAHRVGMVHPRRPLDWTCGLGHAFSAAPWTVLRAGHWCPECVRTPELYSVQAAHSAFFRQVAPVHAEPTSRSVQPNP